MEIEDVEFDEIYLKRKYKKEIEKINSILEELERDKKIQRIYKKFIKRKSNHEL